MKFSMMVPGLTLYPGRGKHWWENVEPGDVAKLARRAEELGYEYLFVPTHFIVQKEAALEMGPRWIHSLSAANFLLGATSRIKVICLLVVPNHNPVELAKAIATADFLAPGRFRPLLMTGYQEWEYDILNVPFAERGAIMDEWLQIMTELWTSDEPEFSGKYVQFSDIVFEPKPAARPFPVWFGGRSKVAVRRVAKYGTGWANSQVPRDRFPEWLEHIQSQPEFVARPRELEISLPLFEGKFNPDQHVILEHAAISFEPEEILEQVNEIAALGGNVTSADDILGHGRYYTDAPGAPKGPRNLEEHLERMQWFSEEIISVAKDIEQTGQ
jgi:hypothetical protein